MVQDKSGLYRIHSDLFLGVHKRTLVPIIAFFLSFATLPLTGPCRNKVHDVFRDGWTHAHTPDMSLICIDHTVLY